MRYCSTCGQPLEAIVPEGDDRTRAVCTSCGKVHYENPRTVVGCVVETSAGLMLCRRAIEPARGRWTFPAGFQEIGETTLEGALRETREEAGAEVEAAAPYAYLDIPHISQSYLVFRGRLRGESYRAGPESLEVHCFDPREVPWNELAFPTIRFVLQLWMEDRQLQRQCMHFGVVHWRQEGDRYDWTRYELRGHRIVP